MLSGQHVSETRETKSYKYFALERANEVLVVVLSRSLDNLCGADLLEERTALIDEIGRPHIRAVIFDFANVQYVDSLVLDTLCQAWKRLRERNAQIALCNLSAIGEKTLTTSRLDIPWRPHPSRLSALEALVSTENAARLL